MVFFKPWLLLIRDRERKKNSIHWTRDQMGPHSQSEVLEKRKISCPYRGFSTWIVQP